VHLTLSRSPFPLAAFLNPDLSVQLVEGRVRRSLQAVRAGKATPQQALQSAVQQLSAELSQQQFATIVDYFSAKHTQGQLSGAKQLLLQALCTVNQQQQQQQPRRQDQQQQAKPCPDSLLSSKTSAPGTVTPAFQQQPPQQQHHQQQHYQKSFPGLPAAAGNTQDVRRSRDQSTPPGPFQHLQQLTSAQQHQRPQQQQGTQQIPCTDSQQQDAPPLAAAAAGGGKCRAFKQGLSPLQV
jgi:hypothetical protein